MHRDVDERVIDASLFPGGKMGIALFRNQAARAAPHRRAARVEAQDLVAHERRIVHDAVVQRDGPRVDELREIADVRHVDHAQTFVSLAEGIEHPQERRGAILGDELHEVR